MSQDKQIQQQPRPRQPATTEIYTQDEETNIIVRFLWMIFIGWWLSGLFYMVGAILTFLVVTSPIGMMVMQKVGWAFSLYSEKKSKTIVKSGNNVFISEKQDTSFIVRYLYFIFIGWWLGFLAMIAAWILGVTIIGLPMSIMIMNRLGKIMTLAS